jgi:hypothetical protein
MTGQVDLASFFGCYLMSLLVMYTPESDEVGKTVDLTTRNREAAASGGTEDSSWRNYNDLSDMFKLVYSLLK